SFAGIERWRGSRTSLGDYLTIHGFFLFVIATALVLDLLLTRDQGATARTLRLLLRSGRPRRFLRLQRSLVRVSGLYALGLALLVAALLGVVALAASGQLVAALDVALLALTGLLFFRRPPRDEASALRQRLWQVALVFVATGLLLTLADEYVVVSGIDIGRTNTVFKTYLQV